MVQQVTGDLPGRVREVGERVRKRLDMIDGEESTKMAIVMPFLEHVLQYNVFEPSEVMPEYRADVGIKKGERVDYALMHDGKPSVLVEVKAVDADLDRGPAAQLHRYFHNTEARFGCLTDGLVWRFYTDIDEKNKMDGKPFFEFRLFDHTPADLDTLSRFTRDTFDGDQVRQGATELRYLREVRSEIAREMENPTDDLAKLMARRIVGWAGKKQVDKFRGFLKSAFRAEIEDRVKSRLQTALNASSAKEEPEAPLPAEPDGPVGWFPFPDAPQVRWPFYPVEISFPDGSRHEIDSYAGVARWVFHWIDSHADLAGSSFLSNGQVWNGISRENPGFKSPHQLPRSGAYVEIRRTPAASLRAMAAVAKEFNVDLSAVSLRIAHRDDSLSNGDGKEADIEQTVV